MFNSRKAPRPERGPCTTWPNSKFAYKQSAKPRQIPRACILGSAILSTLESLAWDHKILEHYYDEVLTEVSVQVCKTPPQQGKGVTQTKPPRQPLTGR